MCAGKNLEKTPRGNCVLIPGDRVLGCDILRHSSALGTHEVRQIAAQSSTSKMWGGPLPPA